MSDFENKLVQALPEKSQQSLLKIAREVKLDTGTWLAMAADSMRHVYFPRKNTLLSMWIRAADEEMVEVAICGDDGVVGLAAMLGGPKSPYEVLVQYSGSALKVEAAMAKQLFDQDPDFRKNILSYANAMMMEVSQTALCNRLHSVEQRLARWILVSKKRSDAELLPLTHELLSKMLGTRRSTVSLAAAQMQSANLIDYTRGKLKVTDAKGLEKISCSCFRVVERQHESLPWHNGE